MRRHAHYRRITTDAIEKAVQIRLFPNVQVGLYYLIPQGAGHSQLVRQAMSTVSARILINTLVQLLDDGDVPDSVHKQTMSLLGTAINTYKRKRSTPKASKKTQVYGHPIYHHEIQEVYNRDGGRKKIAAVKEVRSVAGLSLLEAKQLVEYICEGQAKPNWLG